jgi:hypothetical protein
MQVGDHYRRVGIPDVPLVTDVLPKEILEVVSRITLSGVCFAESDKIFDAFLRS